MLHIQLQIGGKGSLTNLQFFLPLKKHDHFPEIYSSSVLRPFRIVVVFCINITVHFSLHHFASGRQMMLLIIWLWKLLKIDVWSNSASYIFAKCQTTVM